MHIKSCRQRNRQKDMCILWQMHVAKCKCSVICMYSRFILTIFFKHILTGSRHTNVLLFTHWSSQLFTHSAEREQHSHWFKVVFKATWWSPSVHSQLQLKMMLRSGYNRWAFPVHTVTFFSHCHSLYCYRTISLTFYRWQCELQKLPH